MTQVAHDQLVFFFSICLTILRVLGNNPTQNVWYEPRILKYQWRERRCKKSISCVRCVSCVPSVIFVSLRKSCIPLLSSTGAWHWCSYNCFNICFYRGCHLSAALVSCFLLMLHQSPIFPCSPDTKSNWESLFVARVHIEANLKPRLMSVCFISLTVKRDANE